MNVKELSDLIVDYRSSQTPMMTQKKFSELVGISEVSIWKIENELVTPRKTTARKIEKFIKGV